MPDATTTRRVLPVHQSLTRPILIMGVERRAFWIEFMLGTILILGIGTVTSAIIGSIITGVIHIVLSKMAKADPMMIDVFRFHVMHQAFYPARSPYEGKPWLKSRGDK
jgi:type IV secretory pathway TrbD component